MPGRRGRRQKYFDSPCHSDVTILTTVENLINMAMGPTAGNTINFKMLEAILHIFARQLRMMEQHVEIQIGAEPKRRPVSKTTTSKHTAAKLKLARRPGSGRAESKERRFKSKERGKSPTPSSSGDERKKPKLAKSKGKTEENYLEEKEELEKEKLANMDKKERDNYLKDREKAMLAKMNEKTREKYKKEQEEENKERQKKIITNMDESEKAMFAELDDTERLKYLSEKESKDKEQAKLAKILEMDRELHLKQKKKPSKGIIIDERSEKPVRYRKDETEETEETDETNETDEKDDESDEREKDKFANIDEKKKNIKKIYKKDREESILATMEEKKKKKYLKDKEETEKAIIAKMDENEKEKFAKMGKKGRAKYLGEEEKEGRENDADKDHKNEEILAKMEDAEKERFAKMDQNGKEKYLKQKRKDLEDKLPKIDDTKMEIFGKFDKKEENLEESENEMLAIMDDREKEKFAKMDKKGKEKYLTDKRVDREKAILAKMDKKEKEKFAKMDVKGKIKYLRIKKGEESTPETMDEQEEEKYTKMDEKDKKKYISGKEMEKREKDERKQELLVKMDENEKAEFTKMDEKGKENHLKEKIEKSKKHILSKMDKKEQEMFAKMDEISKENYLEKKYRDESILTTMDENEKAKYTSLDEIDREKYLKDKGNERKKNEKDERKEQEKEDEKNKELSTTELKEKEKKKYLKEKKREEKEKPMSAKKHASEEAKLAGMNEKEKEKYSKEKERENREKPMSAKKQEREANIAEMNEKEKENYLQEKEREEKEKPMSGKKHDKEEAILANMNKEEKEKYLKEKEREEKEKTISTKKLVREELKFAEMNEKEKKKYLKEKEREEREKPMSAKKHASEEAKLAEMNEKEKQKYLKEKEREEREKSMSANITKKEQEKFAKMDVKDKEKYLNKKEREEREKTMIAKMDEKERAKFAKMNEKGKEKYFNQKEMEKAMLENMDEKEKKLFSKLDENEKMLFSKMDEKGKENYLIEKEIEEIANYKAEKEKTGSAGVQKSPSKRAVEKRPQTRAARTHVGSIEVVTVSQFELLKAEVKELQDKASPIPLPRMPDNQKLRQDIASGSASLTDTMQAMQVTARVQAAETAISQMAGILTALAAEGAIPMDVVEQMEDVMVVPDQDQYRRSYGASGGAPLKEKLITQGGAWSETNTFGSRAQPGAGSARASARPSALPPVIRKGTAVVSRTEFDNALRGIQNDMTKKATAIATKTQKIADAAHHTATNVAEKLELLFELNNRIDDLFGLVSDYVKQFSGFDAGVTTQMDSFNEQMRQMRHDMEKGVNQLLSATGSSESEAVKELNLRFEALVVGLDITLHSHNELNTIQNQLNNDLTSLLGCVEMLREEKADRDEVLDGMQDKADMSRLAGLLPEKDFKVVHEDLENKLAISYEKFLKQDRTWMKALRDLSLNMDSKSDLIQVEYIKKETEEEFKKIQHDLILLTKALGDPKAALLTRQLSVGALCGPCRVPALQEATDVCGNHPPSLPPLRRLKPGEVKSCEALIKVPHSPQGERPHMCHRWVGGSHTLMSESVVRKQAAPLLQLDCTAPAKKYGGLGVDGRLYKLEGMLDPCVQCNKLNSPIDLKMDGTGDSVKKSNLLLNNNKDQ